MITRKLVCRKIWSRLWDRLLGEKRVYQDTHDRLYGSRLSEKELSEKRKGIKRGYAAAAAGVVLAMAAAALWPGPDGNEALIYDGDAVKAIHRPAAGEQVRRIPVLAAIQTSEGVIKKEVKLTVRPAVADPTAGSAGTEEGTRPPQDADRHEALEGELVRLTRSLSKTEGKDPLTLPAVLEDGSRVRWEAMQKNSPLPLLCLPVLAAACIYRNRFAALKREAREAGESVIRELPEFINKLVLLLGAGLVMTAAFARIVEDRRRGGPEGPDSYFYRQLEELRQAMETTNASMTKGLREFAARTGNREFMRLANILSDNVDKGALLSEKLQSESEFLWSSRKKQAQERGRIAETKLTLPLMVLLLVLVMITTAPAMLEL